MKKITAIFITTILVTCIFAGCTNQEATLSEDNVTPAASAAETEAFDMDESEIRDLYLKLYAEKSKDENFISDVEAKTYEECNFYIRNREDGFISSYNATYNVNREYYYPIVLPDTDEVVIAYTDEFGKLCIYNASQDSHDYFSNIHVPESTEIIDNCPNYCIVRTDNSVQIWKFGTLMSETKVPANSVYTGLSYWEGYIFRNGGDVYSVQIKDNDKQSELTCEAIAHGVKEVISTEYKLNSDAWSQPLFLMNDGSIKAYCEWNGDEDSPRDDVSHLSAPQYEGGYK